MEIGKVNNTVIDPYSVILLRAEFIVDWVRVQTGKEYKKTSKNEPDGDHNFGSLIIFLRPITCILYIILENL